MERTNIQTNFENSKKKSSKKIDEKKPLLDKLAQLWTNTISNDAINTRQNLARRAKAKYFTQAYTKQLAQLKSTLQKSYNNTIYGCAHVLFQEGKKITSHYCNNRWCIVCNRIRTAKLIIAYKDPIAKLKELHLLTLTIRNVEADILEYKIENMQKTISTIINTINKRKKRAGEKNILRGIRKLECTFNETEKTFHPHFHILVEGYQNAVDIKNEWLKHYKDEALHYLQDIRKADKDSLIEIFKYYTKIAKNKAIYIEALDVIFRAMRGKRVYQSFGIKKSVNEDIDTIQSQIIHDLEEAEKTWEWVESDWVDKSGELLTNYKPSEKMNELVKNIKHIDIKIQQ